MSSVRSEALKLAQDTRDRLLTGFVETTTALRVCWTICSLLERERENEWMHSELNGYFSFKTEKEMEGALPEYRKTQCIYLDRFNRPIVVEERLSFLEEYPSGEPIAELEKCAEKGMFIVSGARLNFLREKFGVFASQAQISSVALARILNAVNNRLLDFLNSLILELQYGGLPADIFEETRKAVDKELVALSRPTLEKLVETYRRLSITSTPHEFSTIAFSCRDILQDFTDAIFNPEYLRRSEVAPTREQTKNKVYYALRDKLEGHKKTELQLVSAQVDYLNSYFDKLTAYIQKQTHPKGFEVTREDANRCIMYTYLVIGDIMKFMS
jgi:hypothetical protein